ncbi:MAG: hypothetical protein BWY36_00870 [Candidatus Diapherotrites archaeon ADurb.Bin253]|nr:MAG: hypothetical protein BWY36_00870 [Candidatus Diapherotrites archaeon ADurb.Bin253]
MKNWLDIENTKEVKEYIKFLENDTKIYYVDDFPWRKYQGGLEPAIFGPYEPPEFSLTDIKELIKISHSPFVRWTSNFTDKPTEWWLVNCKRQIKLENLSPTQRSKIRRGLKNCDVKKITPQWLSENGYECYKSAFRRYKGTIPSNERQWKRGLEIKSKYTCFEFWGVFIKEKLIGYSECIVLNDIISTSVIKYNPDYLKYYPSYALTYTILDYYLNQKNYELISNGTRSISHDTQIQKFLEKFGFDKQYCKLNVLYSPVFGFLVKITYTFRDLFNFLYKIIPNNLLHKIIVILRQEKIRRSFYDNLFQEKFRSSYK